MGAEHWLVGIDESGDFSTTERDQVVALLALRGGDTPETDARLRAICDRYLPSYPWPLHGSHLRVPVGHAVAAQARSMTGPAWVDQARRWIEGSRDPAVQRIRERLAAQRSPHWQDLVDAASDPSLPGTLAQALQLRAEAAPAAFEALLTDVAEAWGDGCFLVLAALPPEPACPTSYGTLQGDRYLSLLHAAFERMLATLREDGRPRTVHCRVATRDVRHVGIQSRYQTLDLRMADWTAVLRSAEAFPWLTPPPDPQLRVLPVEVISRFDARCHPTLVLADLVANLCRKQLREGRSLAAVEQNLARLGIPVRRAPPAFPTPLPLCVAGTLAEWLRGPDALTGPPPPGAWPSEQAAEWAIARREVRP